MQIERNQLTRVIKKLDIFLDGILSDFTISPSEVYYLVNNFAIFEISGV